MAVAALLMEVVVFAILVNMLMVMSLPVMLMSMLVLI